MDQGTLRNFSTEEILQCLQSTHEFGSAANLHYQYDILRLQNRPAVSLSMIGRLFDVTKATMLWHYQLYMSRAALPNERGPPAAVQVLLQIAFLGCVRGGVQRLQPQ
jgi:hypothetical protein